MSAQLKLLATTLIVTDLEKSTRFYCEGLGFKQGQTKRRVGEPNSDVAKLAGLPNGTTYLARILQRPEIVLAITKLEEPEGAEAYFHDRENQRRRGALLLFLGSDCKATAKRLVELGGHIDFDRSPPGKVTSPFNMIVTDPDGYIIELLGGPDGWMEEHTARVMGTTETPPPRK